MTGSSRGIGASIVERLALHGADVVINYLSSATAAENVAAKVRELGVKAITVQADVSKGKEVARLFQTAKAEFGRIDIVMSNSGVEYFGKLEELTEEDIDGVFAVNVKAQLLVAQQAYKYLEDRGRLILISSVSAFMVSVSLTHYLPIVSARRPVIAEGLSAHAETKKGVANHAVYGASKAAILGMTKSLATDFGSRGITVNCIAPGGIKTEMYATVARHYIPNGGELTPEEIDAEIGKLSPQRRPGFPEDVAGAVALLSTSEAQWINGQTIHVNGGALMV